MAVHEDGGPMQWLLEQLLAAGARSPRAAALLALTLARRFVDCPAVALHCQPTFKALLLHSGEGVTGDPGDGIEVSQMLQLGF